MPRFESFADMLARHIEKHVRKELDAQRARLPQDRVDSLVYFHLGDIAERLAKKQAANPAK